MSKYLHDLSTVRSLCAPIALRNVTHSQVRWLEGGLHHAIYSATLRHGQVGKVELFHSRDDLYAFCACSAAATCAHIGAVIDYLTELGASPPEHRRDSDFIRKLAANPWKYQRVNERKFPSFRANFLAKAAAFDASHPLETQLPPPVPEDPHERLLHCLFPNDDKAAIKRYRKKEKMKFESRDKLLTGVAEKDFYGETFLVRCYLGLSPAGLFAVCPCQKPSCDHLQALKAAVAMGEIDPPPALAEALAKMTRPTDLHEGDQTLLLRAQNGVAHLSEDATLPQDPPPAARQPLLERFGHLLTALGHDKIDPACVLPVGDPGEPGCRHLRHKKTELAVAGNWLGAHCDCYEFREYHHFCLHIVNMMKWLDERAAADQLCLSGEDKTTRIRHGLADWKWDGDMEPQEWMQEGHTPASWKQVIQNRKRMENLVERYLPPPFHRIQTCFAVPESSRPDIKLHINEHSMRVTEVKNGQADPGCTKIEEVVRQMPELATLCAPIACRTDTYSSGACFKSDLSPELGALIETLSERGLCTVEDGERNARTLEIRVAASYHLGVEVKAADSPGSWQLLAHEQIDGRMHPLPLHSFHQGFIEGQGWIPCDIGRGRLMSRRLLAEIARQGMLLDESMLHRCLDQLHVCGGVDQWILPDGFSHQPPLPPSSCILDLLPHKKGSLTVNPVFLYGNREVAFGSRALKIAGKLRHLEAEKAMLGRLKVLGGIDLKKDELVLPASDTHSLLQQALALGWQVRIEGKITRPGKMKKLKVSTGIDWLECQGQLDFDGLVINLDEIIGSLRRREPYIILADGSRGWLDPSALARLQRLAALGELDKDSGELRFKGGQALLLEALLHELGPVDFDAAAEQARSALQNFDKLEAATPPEGFIGQLRPYQSLGLAWLRFCRDIGLGACLADDMGLGKTVQLLAHLETLRQNGEGPFLVVCPASLLFNWEKEAARFAPLMRVLIQQGTSRAKSPEGLKGADLVLMTYATLRNDIPWLKEVNFACIALDEAQAIKNPGSASALAARLLQGHQRLTLTGTPVENRLDDLWSLFEFLNPGLLGSASNFGRFAEAAGKEAGMVVLAKALRPLILRRTKAEVATDLPPLSRQILWCEMESQQQAYYSKLLAAARVDVLEAKNDKTKFVSDESTPQTSENSFLMLERLLRLRQAACCPALCDKSAGADSPSAKLDVLIPMVEELITEKHQILIFSQFTEFLAIAAGRLKKSGIAYAYLDGKTRDRGAAVDEFQGGGKGVFLISLKAGGTGLNLVNADYVFLLDPWWNPAVEQQAIDRAHRIGQNRPVTAYRLVAKGSIEEKILILQEQKRALADSVLGGDGLDLRSLKREDLEFLLS